MDNINPGKIEMNNEVNDQDTFDFREFTDMSVEQYEELMKSFEHLKTKDEEENENIDNLSHYFEKCNETIGSQKWLHKYKENFTNLLNKENIHVHMDNFVNQYIPLVYKNSKDDTRFVIFSRLKDVFCQSYSYLELCNSLLVNAMVNNDFETITLLCENYGNGNKYMDYISTFGNNKLIEKEHINEDPTLIYTLCYNYAHILLNINNKDEKFYRWINEIPTILFLLIVFLVVFQPNI